MEPRYSAAPVHSGGEDAPQQQPEHYFGTQLWFFLIDLQELPLHKKALLLGGCVLSVLLLATFLYYSINPVPPQHLGLSYSVFSRICRVDHVYPNGRHFIGPLSRFILFPTTLQTVEFMSDPRVWPLGQREMPVHTRTQDGLAVTMELSLQYQLIPAEIGVMYAEFNVNFQQVLIATVRDTVIGVTGSFSAKDMWISRKHFHHRMLAATCQALRRIHVRCWGLQLYYLDLPDSYENSILAAELQRQALSTAAFTQLESQIHARTEVIVSALTRIATVTIATAKANKSFAIGTAQAYARQNRIATESRTLGRIRSEIGLATHELVEYQRYASLFDMDNSSMLFGFPGEATLMVVNRKKRTVPLYPYNALNWAHKVKDHSEICATGIHQSPVELFSCAAAIPYRPPLLLKWKRMPVHLFNDGRAVKLTPSSAILSTLTWNAFQYTLQECHFHIGSEHRVDGKQLAMEMHCKHVRQDKASQIAVLAVLFTVGSQSKLLRRFENHLPHVQQGRENTQCGSAWNFSMDFSYAAQVLDLTRFWSYTGSVTTPPCTEGVTWIVLMTPLQMSTEQLSNFTQAIGWGSPPNGGNARPPVPLNGRTVLGC